MKKFITTLLLLSMGCALGLPAQSKSDELPEGTIIRALRSDDNSGLILQDAKIFIDDINNIKSFCAWEFYFCGTKNGLADITAKPDMSAPGWTSTLALKKGYTFVGHYTKYNTTYWARFHVLEMLTNKDNEIIGARIAYQEPFYTAEEMVALKREQEARKAQELKERQEREEAERARLAEAEARKIFWNGAEVYDESLRAFYLDNYDTNKNGKIEKSEAEAVRSLRMYGYDIHYRSLTGIENFYNLEELYLSKVKITDLSNFSSMYRLESVTIIDCPYIIYTADFSGCTALTYMSIDRCCINNLNLSGCSSLVTYCTTYDLSMVNHLDISDCASLKELKIGRRYFEKSGLQKLTAKNCRSLATIDCSNNELEELNLSGCINLQSLNCNNNNLEELDLAGCVNLQSLYCNDNNLEKLDLAGCVNLKKLWCENNDLKTIKMHKGLEDFDCSYNNSLTSLNLAGYNSLTCLVAYGCNNLKTINLSGCYAIEELYAYYNKSLSIIDLRECHSLTTLYCPNNKLSSLDVSDCRKLSTLECNSNELSALELSNCTKLTKLVCHHNKLSKLDVSKCRELRLLECGNNNLYSLDISNCPELWCVSCWDNKNLKKLNLSKNKKIKIIYCNGTKITKLDISNCEISDWQASVDGSHGTLYLPNAKDGFKTLYTNKNQKIGYYDNQQVITKKMTEADKSLFFEWQKHYGGLYPELTTDDLKFKVKAR